VFVRNVSRIAIFYLMFASAQADSINGARLVDACETALASGFTHTEGMVCHWYVTPCDCYHDDDVPDVCLPADAGEETLAITVINGIRQDPELLQQPAVVAANTVLSELYPCNR